MFDGQNNNKGGYCWGPPMTYYEGSLLQVEWTAQHGCGASNENVDCDLILQYMCHPTVRDGFVTDTITKDTVETKETDPVTKQVVYKYGMNEPYEFYEKCSKRIRNKGLFTADQGLNAQDTAMRTRQENNQNNPHGFECEEERDYYPYWHPSPWRDIAVLTSNPARCSYFKAHSQNVEAKFECTVPTHNNQQECTAGGGLWVSQAAWGMPAPECVENGFSRDNHLGNTKTGFTNTYAWEIPALNFLGSSYRNNDGTANCVFRMRYNMSSTDYAGWGHVDNNLEMIDNSFNDGASPIKQDPYVGYGKDKNGHEWKLRLALNTDQVARTFEDRSFLFFISPRPSDIPASHRIINLNVRGKRGNIVEVFPAVEYDFTPTNLEVLVGDYVHIQWTGCDTNPGGNAGEGKAGTDRSNMVQMDNRRDNYPIKFEEQNMFSPSTAFYLAHINQFDGKVCQTETETNCCKTLEQLKNTGNADQNDQNCAKINAPGANYANAGLVKMGTAGTYGYMSTRNNNFSNRSQKGAISVQALVGTFGITVAAIGAAGFAGAASIAGLVYYAHTHPAGCVANLVSGVKL